MNLLHTKINILQSVKNVQSVLQFLNDFSNFNEIPLYQVNF